MVNVEVLEKHIQILHCNIWNDTVSWMPWICGVRDVASAPTWSAVDRPCLPSSSEVKTFVNGMALDIDEVVVVIRFLHLHHRHGTTADGNFLGPEIASVAIGDVIVQQFFLRLAERHGEFACRKSSQRCVRFSSRIAGMQSEASQSHHLICMKCLVYEI